MSKSIRLLLKEEGKPPAPASRIQGEPGVAAIFAANEVVSHERPHALTKSGARGVTSAWGQVQTKCELSREVRFALLSRHQMPKGGHRAYGQILSANNAVLAG